MNESNRNRNSTEEPPPLTQNPSLYALIILANENPPTYHVIGTAEHNLFQRTPWLPANGTQNYDAAKRVYDALVAGFGKPENEVSFVGDRGFIERGLILHQCLADLPEGISPELYALASKPRKCAHGMTMTEPCPECDNYTVLPPEKPVENAR